jgi:putative ABC transport system substrate-binding protein
MSLRRRDFITLLGGAAATWPLMARAQQADRVRRVGVHLRGDENDPERQSWLASLRGGLRDLGWDEGRNIRIDVRGAPLQAGTNQAFAAELVSLNPDLIVASGPGAVIAVQQVNRTIPIVFAAISDPVGLGIVENLARPGGNVTGFTLFEYSAAGKLLEAVKEFAPSITRAALLMSSTNPAAPGHWRALESAARSLGVQPISALISEDDPSEIERIINTFAGQPNGALIAPPDLTVISHRELIATLAARHRMPAAYGSRVLALSGGLMSYGPDLADNYRRAASYVDRILKGEKPANLPVQQPTKFDFVLNLKTARALGFDVPAATLLRATEVIE